MSEQEPKAGQEKSILQRVLEDLQARHAGTLVIPSWRDIDAARQMINTLPPEERDAAVEDLDRAEQYHQAQMDAVVARVCNPRGGGESFTPLTEGEIYFLTENIDKVPAEQWERVSSTIEASNRVHEQDKEVARDKRAEWEQLVNKLSVLMVGADVMGRVPEPLTADEKAELLANQARLSAGQSNFLLHGETHHVHEELAPEGQFAPVPSSAPSPSKGNRGFWRRVFRRP